MATFNQTVAPLTEPVTVSEAKEYLRITGTDDDPLIASLIQAARVKAELFTERAFISQTWQYTRDGTFRRSIFTLPYPPLQTITTLNHYAADDAETTMDASNYSVDAISAPGRVYLNDTFSWPSDLRKFNSIIVTYVAGYGLLQSDVPEPIRLAIKLMTCEWFENRGEAQSISDQSQKLLWPYRVLSV
jgi:uncharacterized phiE125 gp8 family phage protein